MHKDKVLNKGYTCTPFQNHVTSALGNPMCFRLNTVVNATKPVTAREGGFLDEREEKVIDEGEREEAFETTAALAREEKSRETRSDRFTVVVAALIKCFDIPAVIPVLDWNLKDIENVWLVSNFQEQN